jgi:uncharacterized protein (TIGR02466 family)
VVDSSRGQAAQEPVSGDQIREHMLPIFATPICNYLWPDSGALNRALGDAIFSREQASSGLARSNVGGWHSELDFFAWDLDCVRALKQRVEQFVTELCRVTARNEQAAVCFELEGWANVTRNGQYHSLHSHPNAAWSGVYYVNGNPRADDNHPFSGKLELIDPRPGASLTYAESSALYGRFLVNPSPGQMVLFPGWLQHQVHPYFGSDARITVAFNANVG